MLRDLGGSADCPFRRSASGEWFWKRRTILNARITGDSASGNRYTARQHGDATGQHRNTAGWNRDSANYSWIHIAQRNSEDNGARLEHAGKPNSGKHYATIHHQSQHAE